MEHTQGNWEIDLNRTTDTDASIVRQDDGQCIAIVLDLGHDNTIERDKHARLIAAAPETAAERDTLKTQRDELLAACEAAFVAAMDAREGREIDWQNLAGIIEEALPDKTWAEKVIKAAKQSKVK